MELSQAQLALRPRSAWEAIDLGLVMLRTWWRPLTQTAAVWMAVWALGFIALGQFLGLRLEAAAWLVLFGTWWLKPWLDRALLAILSRRVFGTSLEWTAAFRMVFRPPFAGLLWHLTLGRLSPTRSFKLPVYMLEGLPWRARRARFSTLLARGGSQAATLTFVLLAVKVVFWGCLMIAAIAVADPMSSSLVPDGATDWYVPAWAWPVGVALYLIVVALLEPFYVAAGFAMYLNRRTVLEGWDIEIEFRRLTERQARFASPRANAAGLVAAAIIGFSLVLAPIGETLAASAVPSAAHTTKMADRSAPERARTLKATDPSSDSLAREVLGEILDEPPFRVERTLRRLGTRGDWDWSNLFGRAEKGSRINFGWLVDFFSRLNLVGKVLLWVAAIALAVVVAWKIFWWLGSYGPRGRPRMGSATTNPTRVEGVERAVPLPSDVLKYAEAALGRGALRDALSVLYRAGVDETFPDRDPDLDPDLDPAPRRALPSAGPRSADRSAAADLRALLAVSDTRSMTEGDVLRVLAKLPDDPRWRYFRRLVRAWRQAAYSTVPVPQSEVTALVAGWPAHFSVFHSGSSSSTATKDSSA